MRKISEGTFPFKEKSLAFAKQLQAEICLLRNTYVAEIQREYQSENKEILEKVVSARMIALQRDSGAVAVVLKGNRREIFEACVSFLRLQLVEKELKERSKEVAKALLYRVSWKDAQENNQHFRDHFDQACIEKGIISQLQRLQIVMPLVLTELQKYSDNDVEHLLQQ
jgi:hypothetical protein